MKRKLPLYAVILMLVFSVAATAIVTSQICYQAFFVPMRQQNNRTAAELSKKIDDLDPDKDLTVAGKVRTIRNYYLKYYTGELNEEEIEKQVLAQLLKATGDKYAEYYTAEEYKEENSASNGVGVGIGVYVTENDAGTITITHVEEGSPAEKAGLMRGDVIVALGDARIGKNAEAGEIGYRQAADLMYGPAGSDLKLTFVRAGEERTFSITRAEITYKTVRYALKEGGIGYIRILSFGGNTFDEFKAAVDSLTASGASALIFDVRANGGGSLTAIHKVLDYLIEDGEEPYNVILSTKDALDNQRFYRCGDGHAVDLPMIVLTDRRTASAAELFACALRDYEKAELVGGVTYGKGVAQSIIRLSDGSAFKMTTNFYNPPKSENYDGKGLMPDHPAPTEHINFDLLEFEEDPCCAEAVRILSGGQTAESDKTESSS